LFTFVISLVVVGTTLFVATRIAISQVPEGDKPAMSVPQPVRGQAGGHDRGEAPETADETPDDVATLLRDESTDRARASQASAWQRVRAVVLLAVLLTILGVLVAVAIAVFGAVVLNGLRSAVQ
jgi:hypothetical protein